MFQNHEMLPLVSSLSIFARNDGMSFTNLEPVLDIFAGLRFCASCVILGASVRYREVTHSRAHQGTWRRCEGPFGSPLEQPAGRQPHLYELAQRGAGSRIWQVDGASW